MKSQVTVVDYGIGNLHSVVKALEHEGGEVVVTSEPDVVTRAERLVIPGVGAFADGIAGLRSRGLIEPISAFLRRERPLLGICLGMQLLLSESEEFGSHHGLAVVPGRVVAIAGRPGLKVPQIGWNRIAPPPGGSWEGSVLASTEPGSMFYFVHSYTAVPDQEMDRLADADYGGVRISAAIRRGHVTGCQFHPEKSGPAGLAILTRFLAS